jgi:hypothetical protein
MASLHTGKRAKELKWDEDLKTFVAVIECYDVREHLLKTHEIVAASPSKLTS